MKKLIALFGVMMSCAYLNGMDKTVIYFSEQKYELPKEDIKLLGLLDGSKQEEYKVENVSLDRFKQIKEQLFPYLHKLLEASKKRDIVIKKEYINKIKQILSKDTDLLELAQIGDSLKIKKLVPLIIQVIAKEIQKNRLQYVKQENNWGVWEDLILLRLNNNRKGSFKTMRPLLSLVNLRGGEVFDKIICSPDGCRIISTSSIGNSIKVWNVDMGNHTTLNGHTQDVHAIDVSSNNKYIVSGADDKTIKIWDLKKGTCIKTICFDSEVRSVKFSKDNSIIAVGFANNTITLLEADSGKILKKFNACATGSINFLAFTSNEELISGSWDNRIRIWDLGSFICKTKVCMEESFSPIDISSTKVVTGKKGQITTWDLNTTEKDTSPQRTFFGHQKDDIKKVVFSPNATRIASCDKKKIMVWEVATGKLLQEIKTPHNINSITFSPDNSLVAGLDDGSIRIWEPPCSSIYEYLTKN